MPQPSSGRSAVVGMRRSCGDSRARSAPSAPAHAADTDIVNIPDAKLKQELNKDIGAGRTATQDITVGEAAAFTGTLSLAGPIADLVVEGGLMTREDVTRQLSPSRLSGVHPITQTIAVVVDLPLVPVMPTTW